MPKTIRKTPTMQMMEYKHQKDIETLILEALVQAKGEQKEASVLLDVSESSICRWIQELDLTKKASQIRKRNGLVPTAGELRMKTSGDKELIELVVLEPCSECGVKFDSLIVHNVTQVNKKDDKTIAVVRDELNRKHWFSLDLSKLGNG